MSFVYCDSSQKILSNGTEQPVIDIDESLKAAYLDLQHVTRPASKLSISERNIIKAIDICLKNWEKPWTQAYLSGSDKFFAVYNLIEGFQHYEQQICRNPNELTTERTNAIAQAVARLIDCGNAMLNLDLIIRTSDEASNELDPANLTTIELLHAHIKANKLREKLLYNYFKNDRSSSRITSDVDYNNQSNYPASTLKVPSPSRRSSSPSKVPSPTFDSSSLRLSTGSSNSINIIPSDPPKSPGSINSQLIEIKTPSTQDLNSSQLEMKHMIATIRSNLFSGPENVSTRRALLLGVLAKIESLLGVPTNTEKLTNCFELADALFDSVEKLPLELRGEEVRTIVTSLLKTIVRKVYVDDRDHLVEFQHAHWATYLLSLIRLMTASDFSTHLRHFSNLTDLSAFLKDYLFIVKRFVSNNQNLSNNSIGIQDTTDCMLIYPDCWIEITLLVCKTFLSSLVQLLQVLKQYFGSNKQIWASYIDCLMCFILSSALRPTRSMFKERQKLLAQDLLKTSVQYVWITWNSLNIEHRQQMCEDLIEPLLRACMTLDTQYRTVLLPIFYDMMRCDYANQYIVARDQADARFDDSGGSQISTIRHLRDDISLTSNCSDSPTRRLESRINYLYEETFSNPHDQRQAVDAQMLSNNSKGISQIPQESLPYLSIRESNCSGGSDDGTVLTKFTHLMVGKLNMLLMESDFGDEQFKDEFCCAISGDLSRTMINRTAPYYNNPTQLRFGSADDGRFKGMAKHTAALIEEFIQICLDSRQANKLSYNHLYLLCLFRLVLFFRDKVDVIELYLTYLHKLWALHHSTGRFIEAGYTLLEHAKTIEWSEKPLESHYRIMTRSFNEPLRSYFDLKNFLYTTTIEYFDQGQLWEAAVPLCRELIDIYQFKLYDYAKVSQLLAKLSSYMNSIASTQVRNYPEYFRVTFYGLGFPRCLRQTTMIYRGKPYEKLSEFQTTLLNKYPDAKLLNTLNQPSDEVTKEADGKYLLINSCSPVVDLKSKFNIELKQVNECVQNYYKYNECDKFEFSKRIYLKTSINLANRSDGTANGSTAAAPIKNTNDNGFANMWRERTVLTTNSLPGMLQFFPVFLNETSIINPIESAIEDLERTNDRLYCAVNRFKFDKRQEQDVRLLGQLLLGIVDAAVNGGIAKYEEAFFQPQPGQRATNWPSTTSSTLPKTLSTTTTSSNCPPPNSSRGGSGRLGDKGTLDESLASLRLCASADNNPATATNSSIERQNQKRNCYANENKQIDHLYADVAGTRPTPTSTLGGDLPNAGDHSYNHHGGASPDDVMSENSDRWLNWRPSNEQINRLKHLIAQQIPLLDEAIKLHSDRIADVMRPQHEHLEESYKRLKHHIMSKYSRYLPSDYNRTSSSSSSSTLATVGGHHNHSMRSLRSYSARSPARSHRFDWRNQSSPFLVITQPTGSTNGRPEESAPVLEHTPFIKKRMSDVGVGRAYYTSSRSQQSAQPTQAQSDGRPKSSKVQPEDIDDSEDVDDENYLNSSNIPYRQLSSERRSLPVLTGVPGLDNRLIGRPRKSNLEQTFGDELKDEVGRDEESFSSKI